MLLFVVLVVVVVVVVVVVIAARSLSAQVGTYLPVPKLDVMAGVAQPVQRPCTNMRSRTYVICTSVAIRRHGIVWVLG